MAKESLLGSTRPGIKLERYDLKDQDERGIWTSGLSRRHTNRSHAELISRAVQLSVIKHQFQ
jgi:hypothetical protein